MILKKILIKHLRKLKDDLKILEKQNLSLNFPTHPVILVDDGIASGFTMLVAVEALKK